MIPGWSLPLLRSTAPARLPLSFPHLASIGRWSGRWVLVAGPARTCRTPLPSPTHQSSLRQLEPCPPLPFISGKRDRGSLFPSCNGLIWAWTWTWFVFELDCKYCTNRSSFTHLSVPFYFFPVSHFFFFPPLQLSTWSPAGKWTNPSEAETLHRFPDTGRDLDEDPRSPSQGNVDSVFLWTFLASGPPGFSSLVAWFACCGPIKWFLTCFKVKSVVSTVVRAA